ncbi:hypothetical protein AWB68_06467 [Caballeronia choica]|uniref:Uncharacterized protein n=1 Tax=Caballeronia choica TaxID=326476 RepID=A0A158KPE8_9BURK|nr:hypothetical protein [Caballeronia choica]SAL82301.1 hypothetical protein AWB68_06467 [Caballeronia choica]
MEMEQRRLNPELFQWLDERQSQLKVVKTTTTPHGQVLDWIPIESQHPEGKVPSPPPSESMPAHAHDAKHNNGTAETDTANGGADLYTIQMHMNSGTNWGSYFYVGGPTP